MLSSRSSPSPSWPHDAPAASHPWFLSQDSPSSPDSFSALASDQHDPGALLRAWQRQAAVSPMSAQSLLSPEALQGGSSSQQPDCAAASKTDSLHAPHGSGQQLEQLAWPTSSAGANGATGSPFSSSSHTATAAALSVQASPGAGVKKPSKRRSRAMNKPPITVLSADMSNFRDMVQKLTGIPTSPSVQRNGFQLWTTSSGVSVLKPHPPTHGLHTLDTSSAFFLLDGKSSAPGILQNESFLQSFPSAQFLQASQPQTDSSFNANWANELAFNRRHLTSVQLANQGNPNDRRSASTPSLPDFTDREKSEGATTERLFAEMLQESLNGTAPKFPIEKMPTQSMVEVESFNRIQAADLERFLLGNDRLELEVPGRPSLHPLADSWMSSETIHAAPKMEVAHSA